MGLAAFNRAREQRAQENAAILKAEQAKAAEKEKADKKAAAAASKLIAAIDAKAPEAVSVVGARVSYNALTAEQAARVDADALIAAEKTLLKRLVNDNGNKSAVSAGNTPDNAGGDGGTATDTDAPRAGNGDNSPEQ